MELDCSACKTPASMTPTKIGKFSGVIRVIGVILLIPSFLGMGFAALMFLSFLINFYGSSSSPRFAILFVILLTIGIISLVVGLLGWLLLLNRKVYKCLRCGFILDRA